MSVLTTVTV